MSRDHCKISDRNADVYLCFDLSYTNELRDRGAPFSINESQSNATNIGSCETTHIVTSRIRSLLNTECNGCKMHRDAKWSG